MPRQLCVYLDCYDLASEDGVVKVSHYMNFHTKNLTLSLSLSLLISPGQIRQVLDSSWSDGGDIVSLFDSETSSAITSYPLKKSKADEKTSLKRCN